MTVMQLVYMERALNHLRQTGQPVLNTDVARLVPLVNVHLNLLGRYTFALREPNTQGMAATAHT